MNISPSSLIRKAIGALLIAIGIPIFILPIPFGFVLIGVGVALLLGHNIGSIMEQVRKRKNSDPNFGRFADRLKGWSPHFIRRWLKQYDL